MSQNPSRRRPRTVTILGWLLFLQGWIIFFLCVYHFNLNEGSHLLNLWLTKKKTLNGSTLTFMDFINQVIANAASRHSLTALIESAALLVLTVLTFTSAFGFFRLWRIAWVQAMFIQGVSLFTALLLYFNQKPVHIYILMTTGILMVVYLNYADLHTYFQSIPEKKNHVNSAS